MDNTSRNIGHFYSWVIKSENLALKETDKSVFEHHGSGIPKEIRWFFEVEGLAMKERLDIVLIYEGKEYKAYINRESVLGRTQMIWYTDLSRRFNEYFKSIQYYPILQFQRNGVARYVV